MIPKFRAFNKKTKKMYSIDGFKASERKIYRCSLADDEFRCGRLETFHFVEDNLDDYILMQSTGLKDKNGVEIFENDIVLTTRFIGRADENGGFYEYEKDYKGVVRMLEGAWVIGTGKDVVDLWTEADENEVIGNIHQNSDLLEEVEG
ncbi:YopX family protein [Streptococcus pyogenes]